jgi:hypothetical protein
MVAVSTHRRIKTSLPKEYQEGANNGTKSGPLARFLGLFSIGLGIWELTGNQCLQNRTGVRYPGLLRAYGVREVATGVGILASRRPGFWLWSRVAGDIVDLSTIAAANRQASGGDRTKTLEAAGAVLGVTVLDLICVIEHSCNPGTRTR